MKIKKKRRDEKRREETKRDEKKSEKSERNERNERWKEGQRERGRAEGGCKALRSSPLPSGEEERKEGSKGI